MKSFGKSFGVRAAIGGATILSGVYAAALAQKDRQDHSVNWSANPPSLGQPVAPIEGQLAAGQLSDEIPAPESRSLATMASGLIPDQPSPGQQRSVQLVQHTEPAGIGMELPASLSADSAEEAGSELSSSAPVGWSMPPADNPTPSQNTTASEAPAMALPVADAPPQADLGSPLAAESPSGLAPQAALGAAMSGPPAAMGIPAELGPAADLSVGASEHAAPSVFATPTAADPPSVLSQGLSVGPAATQDVANLSNVQPQIAEEAAAAAAVATGVAIVASDSAGGPANLLRSDATDMNALRG
ncbi:MAG: hypothetical protein ACPGLY_20625, partial [Rubripirellula sp.]